LLISVSIVLGFTKQDSSVASKKAKYSSIKKAKSHAVENATEDNFGAFNANGFGDSSSKKQRKNSNHMQIDDEITNISNTQDCFGKQDSDDLPAFGSLLSSGQKEDTQRRKSQYIPQPSAFSDLGAFGQGGESNKNKSISGRYHKQESFSAFGAAPTMPSFGAMGQQTQDELMAGSSQSQPKPKQKQKQSI
jgi:hypothetical protein